MGLLSTIKYKKTPLLTFTSNYYPAKGGHTYQSFKEFENVDDLDILFLGSSHAYRGFDPRIFKQYGYNSYNLGTSGQNLESSEFIFKKLLSKKKIKTVVLEIFSNQFEKNENLLESNIDIAFNAPSYMFNVNYIFFKKDWRFVNLFFYKLFTARSNPVYLDSTYVGKGFSENKTTVKDTIFKYNNDFVPFVEKYNTLECIIKQASLNKQKLILVSHPLPHQYPIKQHIAFKEFINPLLKKYNISYFDYTTDHNLLASKHFYDYNHLNQKGVQIFDSLLINNLEFKKLLNEN
jgi:hypothetical protein